MPCLRRSDFDNRNNDQEIWLRGGRVQFFATISCCLSLVTLGACEVWPNLLLELSRNNEPTIPFTNAEENTVISIMSIGSIIGYLTVQLFMGQKGRKFSILLYTIPQIISFIMIIFSKNLLTLYGARILAGIGTGACASLTPIYIGEITDKRVRGMLSSFQIILSDIGILATTSMATYLPYQTMNKILLSFPVISFIIFCFMPESPYFYIMRGRDEEAAKSLMRLRGAKNRELVETEIERIKKGLEEDESFGRLNLIKLLSTASNRRAFLVVISAHLTSVCFKNVSLVYLAPRSFDNSGLTLSTGNSYIVIRTFKIFAGLVVTQVVERTGRRLLFLSSGIASSTALAIVGFYFFSRNYLQLDVSFISWLPLVGLITLDVAAAAGISSIPLILLGEIFPISVKKSAVTCTFITSLFATLIREQIFSEISIRKMYITLLAHSVYGLFGTIFAFRIMLETKGKTLEEIQTILNSR